MPKRNTYNGVTSNTERIKLIDTAYNDGRGKTGLTEASSGLIIATICNNEATTTRYRAGSSEIETITTLGTFAAPTSGKCRFKEVDATNHPGHYEIQLADARYAVSGARMLTITVTGTGFAQYDEFIQLEHTPADVRQLLGTAWLTPGTAGTPDVNVKLWNALTTVALPLVPTTAGRTLDVSAGGEAGVDWANIGSPTTAVNLSGTTVKTATDVETDTQDIQTRLPAALISGRMDSSVGAIASGVDLSATMKASVNAEADTALADVGLTTTVTGRIDVAVSTRLASGSYTAPPAAAAIATAVRTELTTELGRIDAAISSVSAPTAATVASAVRTELTTELSRVDVAVSTRLATAGYTAPPAAAAVATAVRTELTTELSRVDVAVSTRAAPSDLSGLATTAGLASVKAQTDKLTFNADNAVSANVTHVNNTGPLIENSTQQTKWGAP